MAAQQSTAIHNPAVLGAAIRARRKADGLTLVETAGLTNVGIRFLSELENGKATVRLDLTLRVLGALGLELCLSPPAASRPLPDLATHPAPRDQT